MAIRAPCCGNNENLSLLRIGNADSDGESRSQAVGEPSRALLPPVSSPTCSIESRIPTSYDPPSSGLFYFPNTQKAHRLGAYAPRVAMVVIFFVLDVPDKDTTKLPSTKKLSQLDASWQYVLGTWCGTSSVDTSVGWPDVCCKLFGPLFWLCLALTVSSGAMDVS
jgi:hypothetical protein